jgi:GTPase SAR1 family protein
MKPPASTQIKKPVTQEEWTALEFEIAALFDGAPVDEEQLFAGRIAEILKMLTTVMERSRHVVLFGDKGVGKTSLSNVFWKRYHKTLRSFIVARVQASPSDNFSSLWIRALEELQASASTADEQYVAKLDTNFSEITPTQVRRELQKIGANALPIIIVDEYSEITDLDARLLTAKLIKELYDFSVTTTVILVGVAENISQLIEDHASLDRALVQVPLNRMPPEDLKEVIQRRISKTVMKFNNDATWTIVILSRGLPFFTQTLSKHAARHAILDHRVVVENDDVQAAMTAFIEDTGVSFRDAYRVATRTNQKNFLKQSLLACALARTDDEGFFTATDVVEPYSAIMGSGKRIAHFEKHLRRFSSADGGNILIKRGGERQQTFRFKDPMMHPYVIIRGIQSGMIPEDARNLLLQKEQAVLPI